MVLLVAFFSLPLIAAASFAGRVRPHPDGRGELRLGRALQIAVLVGVASWHETLPHWNGACRDTSGQGGVSLALALIALTAAVWTAFVGGGRGKTARIAWGSALTSITLFVLAAGWIALTNLCDPT